MAINPFAALSATERVTYRTALAGHVAETMYSAWQRDRALHVEDIVNEVRGRVDAVEGAEFVEIHRAIAQLEWAGFIAQAGTGSGIDGLWTWMPAPRAVIPGTDFCRQPGCLRPADHAYTHLPDLHAIHLSTELVVCHDTFIAAWAPGAPWMRIYPDAVAWSSDADPSTVLAAPHTLPYTHLALAGFITEWLGHDEYPWPDPSPYVVTPGVDGGTLHHRHPVAQVFAVWDHGSPAVEFFDSAADWAAGKDPIAVADVPYPIPFTGAVLAQLTDDWVDRRHENTPTRLDDEIGETG